MSDKWPRFWFEPWRWADPGWHRRYGAPLVPAHRPSARVLFGGWIGTFGLEREWRAPADRRWPQLLCLCPSALREAAAVLGWIALLRAPGGMAHLCGAERDPLLRCALRYRDVNCVEARIAESPGAAYDAQACGLHLLRRAAEAQWPDIARRLAMMAAPDAPHDGDTSLAITRIDVARSLTIGLAAARRLAAAAAAVGAGLSDKAVA